MTDKEIKETYRWVGPLIKHVNPKEVKMFSNLEPGVYAVLKELRCLKFIYSDRRISLNVIIDKETGITKFILGTDSTYEIFFISTTLLEGSKDPASVILDNIPSIKVDKRIDLAVGLRSKEEIDLNPTVECLKHEREDCVECFGIKIKSRIN